jgi:hypothetical protein
VPMTTQERAYTSPIWYTPAAALAANAAKLGAPRSTPQAATTTRQTPETLQPDVD